MENFKNQLPESPELDLAAYAKQVYDSSDHQERLRLEREAERRYYEETIRELKKEADRLERAWSKKPHAWKSKKKKRETDGLLQKS